MGHCENIGGLIVIELIMSNFVIKIIKIIVYLSIIVKMSNCTLSMPNDQWDLFLIFF